MLHHTRLLDENEVARRLTRVFAMLGRYFVAVNSTWVINLGWKIPGDPSCERVELASTEYSRVLCSEKLHTVVSLAILHNALYPGLAHIGGRNIAMSQSHEKSHALAATTAAEKLEHFFKSLNPQEQTVVSQMVHAALLHAASEFKPTEAEVPAFVQGLTGKTAPLLVSSLRLPGSLAAHSIPGCNRAALVALQSELQKG
jgi:hypothetical protein